MTSSRNSAWLTSRRNGGYDYNKFKEFSVDVVGQDGADKLELKASGQDGSYTGFAIDHVSLKTTGTLFAEDFESYGANIPVTPTTWQAVDLTTGGWDTSLGAPTEIAVDGYLGSVKTEKRHMVA